MIRGNAFRRHGGGVAVASAPEIGGAIAVAVGVPVAVGASGR